MQESKVPFLQEESSTLLSQLLRRLKYFLKGHLWVLLSKLRDYCDASMTLSTLKWTEQPVVISLHPEEKQRSLQSKKLELFIPLSRPGCYGTSIRRSPARGCSQLPTNLLPVWIQNGIPPSVWDRCGPLKLYLYSKRRWGASPGVEASAETSATLRWNINAERKVKMKRGALAAGRSALDTAMFLYHCWRSAESTRMTGCALGQQGVFSLDGFLVSFLAFLLLLCFCCSSSVWRDGSTRTLHVQQAQLTSKHFK